MDAISLIVSVIGVVLSVYAVLSSKSAKKMAASVVKRFNESADAARLRKVLERIQSAKEAALRRQNGAPAIASRGVGATPATDLLLLQRAHDALRTELPLDMSQQARNAAKNAAEAIDKALQYINNPTPPRDGWKDALSTLQVVIPEMEVEERRLNNRSLLGADG